MSEGRDIYHEPKQKVLLRTADVYQTEVDDEVAGYSDKLLAIVADYHNGGRPEGMNAQAMVGFALGSARLLQKPLRAPSLRVISSWSFPPTRH